MQPLEILWGKRPVFFHPRVIFECFSNSFAPDVGLSLGYGGPSVVEAPHIARNRVDGTIIVVARKHCLDTHLKLRRDHDDRCFGNSLRTSASASHLVNVCSCKLVIAVHQDKDLCVGLELKVDSASVKLWEYKNTVWSSSHLVRVDFKRFVVGARSEVNTCRGTLISDRIHQSIIFVFLKEDQYR